MKWTRSETLALATNRCVRCHGIGLRWDGLRDPLPCTCVLRAIFRVCYERFVYCVTKDKHIPRTTYTFNPGPVRKFSWSWKAEEYVADFYLVTKRSLSEEDFQLFKFHYLYGADFRLCCRKLGTDKSNFFQRLYLMQERLGRIFRELRPYPLFPLDEYFNGTRQGVSPIVRIAAAAEARRRRAMAQSA